MGKLNRQDSATAIPQLEGMIDESNANITKVEAKADKNSLSISELRNLIKSAEIRELIWENQSPTTAFNVQTIYENSSGWVSGKVFSDYEEYRIDYVTRSTSTYAFLSTFGRVGEVARLCMVSGESNKCGSRKVTIGSNGFAFEGAWYGGAADNNYCVPERIYGIRRIE